MKRLLYVFGSARAFAFLWIPWGLNPMTTLVFILSFLSALLMGWIYLRWGLLASMTFHAGLDLRFLLHALG